MAVRPGDMDQLYFNDWDSHLGFIKQSGYICPFDQFDFREKDQIQGILLLKNTQKTLTLMAIS